VLGLIVLDCTGWGAVIVDGVDAGVVLGLRGCVELETLRNP